MTKEEYEKLLKSDYWKGYSYSLIKERDFTCEDCGRKFLNERHRLQVHHLVYRDTNPWSYKPEELVVLCEECHKKRHGIIFDSSISQKTLGTGFSYSSSTENVQGKTYSVNGTRDIGNEPLWIEEDTNRFKFRYILYGLLLFCVLRIGYGLFLSSKISNESDSLQGVTLQNVEEVEDISSPPAFQYEQSANQSINTTLSTQDSYNDEILAKEAPSPNETFTSTMISSQPEASLKDTHDKASAKEAASRRNEAANENLSASDMLERINHENAIKQAERAGVSTEGSTLDILDRI
ncbi:MAG: HNH endonuclease, partial [Prevotella sp.]|nr:HNH endonuclease [Prevotella sp.]